MTGVWSAALVMALQNRIGLRGIAAFRFGPVVFVLELAAVHLLADQKVVSPGSVISTFWSICRTITSICLSLILTPCRR